MRSKTPLGVTAAGHQRILEPSVETYSAVYYTALLPLPSFPWPMFGGKWAPHFPIMCYVAYVPRHMIGWDDQAWLKKLSFIQY